MSNAYIYLMVNPIGMTDPKGYLTKKQVDLLIDSAKDYRAKMFIKVLFYSDRRVSEIVLPHGITVADINFDDKMITWRILKKNQRWPKKDNITGEVILESWKQPKRPPPEVTLPMYPKILDQLKDYIMVFKLRDSDHLFDFKRKRAFQIVHEVGDAAAHKYPDSFKWAEKEYMWLGKVKTRRDIIVGRDSLHPHHFRHSWIVWASKKAKNPEDYRLIQMISQHADMKTLQTYWQLGNTDLRRFLNNLGE